MGVFGKDESLRGIPRLSRLPQHSHMGYACDCPLKTKLLNRRAQARRHQHPAGNPMKNHVLAFIFMRWSADVWYRSVSKPPPGKQLIQKPRETDQHPCPPQLMKSQEGPGKHRHCVISSSDFFFFSGGSGWISSTPFITIAFLYVYDSFCL